MNLTYGIKDRPETKQMVVFAFQQLLAIMAATIAVPAIIGNGMTASAALFGAGAGTIIYQLFTRFNSPVFLGSSFAFIGSMLAAFAGGVSISVGFLGLIIGATFAGLVYVIISLIVKAVGTKWIDKLMPAVVIGPTVTIIGLSLAGNAVGDLMKGDGSLMVSPYLAMVCGLVTLAVVIICSVYGKKMTKLIPFVIGIGAGYALALIFTLIGKATGNAKMLIIDFAPFAALLDNGKVALSSFVSFPEFSFLKAAKGLKNLSGSYIATIFVAYVPVAFVVFAEHLADHKNLSTIINKDLITDPGLDKTLLGDGVGSMVGAFFGGCPNTTYGESVGCVAITGNASVATITTAAILSIGISFISPLMALLDSIPACVMGGVCMSLYGFIAISGLKMIQKVNLEDNRNVFTASVVLISGIGGLSLTIGKITLTSVACALILGILTNILVNKKSK
ncbi:MAG: hypothetical protein J6R23_03030 [Spirochaetales bacterium]|nr:hypothetical protein [Spirochaetales bacterium]